METNLTIKSQEVSERIEAIKIDLKYHRRCIRRLYAYAEGRRKMDMTPYAPRVIKFTCIGRSENRFRWSIQNISSQIALLERELDTLIKYMVNEDAA